MVTVMQQDPIQRQIRELKDMIQETRTEIRVQENRINGLWWKIGVMAGVIAVITSEVFGSGIGGAVSTLLGVLPL